MSDQLLTVAQVRRDTLERIIRAFIAKEEEDPGLVRAAGELLKAGGE